MLQILHHHHHHHHHHQNHLHLDWGWHVQKIAACLRILLAIMLHLLGLQCTSFKKSGTPCVSSNTCRGGVDSIDPKVFIWHENSRKELLNMPIQNHSWKIWKSRSRHKTSLKPSWEMLQILHHHHHYHQNHLHLDSGWDVQNIAACLCVLLAIMLHLLGLQRTSFKKSGTPGVSSNTCNKRSW